MPLTEEHRLKLDGIVSQMSTNGESDDNIQFVVNDFKSKYEPMNTGISDQTVMDFNPEKDDDIKAKAIIKDRMDDLDPEGEVYFDKLMDPKATMQLLQKVTDPQPMDAKEIDEILRTGSSVLSPKMVPATSPDEEKHSIDPEGGYVSITKPDTTEEPKGPSMREATDADFQRSWGDIFSNFFKYGTANEEYVRVRERMEASLPDIGKAVKLAKREEKRRTIKAKWSELGEAERALVDGLMSAIKKPALGIMHHVSDQLYLNNMGIDLGFEEALANDINIWSETLAHTEDLKKEWKENEGHNWYNPSFLGDFVLRSGPTMALSMYTGGALAAGTEGAILKLALYGGGSGFTEAISESGAAAAQAEAMGASIEEKADVARRVFRKNFVESAIFNSLQYGSGKFQKMLDNKVLKTAVLGGGILLEPEQELRQDEISRRAINEIVAKKAAENEFFLTPRVIEGFIDPEKRDLTMLSLMMGAADPAMGYLQDLKSTAIKTGKGKAVLDTNVNFTEKSLNEELQTYEQSEDLDEHQMKRYEALEKNSGDVMAAVPELVEIETEQKVKEYNAETIEGVLEDATIGKVAKEEIVNLPEPEAQVTAEQINDTLNTFQDVGLKKADAEVIRKTYGLKDLTQAESVAVQSHIRNAKEKGMDHRAIEIATEVNNNTDRMLSPDEHMGLVLREVALQNQYDTKIEEAIQLGEAGNMDAQVQAVQQARAIEKNIDIITEASVKSGSRLGRAFNVRKARINRATYSLKNMRKVAQQLSGKKLTVKQHAKLLKDSIVIKDLENKVEKLEKQLEIAEKKAKKSDAQQFIGEVMKERKKQSKSEDIAARQENIKEQLRKMGHRVNDITGVTVEATKLLGMLAETYIEQGINTLPDLMTQLKKDLPDMSEKNIYDAFSNRKKNVVKKVKSQTQKVVTELKKQATLQSKIMDGINGIFDPARKTPPKSKEIEKLLGQFQDLKRSYFQTETDLAKVDMIQRKIDEVQDAIENGTVVPKEQRTARAQSQAVMEAQQRYKEARALMDTNEKIRDLEKQLETGNYKLPPELEKKVVDNNLERARLKLHQARMQVRHDLMKMAPVTIGSSFDKLGGSLRGLMASMDVSYVARQGGFLAPGHPVAASKAFVASLEAALTQDKHDKIQMAIKEHPNQFFRDKYGLKLTDLDGLLTEREEMFTNSWVENLPGIKQSNRNMVTGLNVLRASLFDTFMSKYPDATDAELKAYADYINSATGRGSLGKFERSAHTLSRIFFAPRWAMSRFQVMMAPFSPKYLKHKSLRKEMARDYASYLGTMSAILMLAKGSGAEVELDPSKGDFGKMVMPNGVRVDLPGSMGPTLRLIGATIKKAGNTAGLWKDGERIDPLDKLGRFTKYKFSPIASLVAESITGKDVMGQETDWAKSSYSHTVPLIFQTAEEVYEKDPSMDSVMMGLLFEAVGMGVQVYKDRKKKGSTIPLKDL